MTKTKTITPIARDTLEWLRAGAPVQKIDGEAIKFDMNYVIYGNYEQGHPDECGTACCIAGYALICQHGLGKAYELSCGSSNAVTSRAAAVLGLRPDCAYDLFYPQKRKMHSVSPYEAADMLEHVLNGGTADW